MSQTLRFVASLRMTQGSIQQACLSKFRRVLLCLACSIGLIGCAGWREATVPLRTLSVQTSCDTRPDTLLVLLPGIGMAPEEFLDEGFVQAVRDAGLAADVLLVDAHLGYYNNRSVVDRLRDDVLRPARAQGYRQVWLAGISLGGLGALLYAQQQGDVDGLLLIAPYLGERLTALDIRNAGGLKRWRPPAAPDAEFDVVLWRWLQQQTDASSTGRAVPLLLAYGLGDRFAYNAGVLAEVLPASRVFTMPGGHDWPQWRPLWRRMLEAAPIARGGCPGPAATR